MGLYTSSRIAHPMTHAQDTLLRAGSDLMSELYPSLGALQEPKHLRMKSDDRYENRGTFDKFWGETSPLLFHGQLVRMETRYLGPFSGALDAGPEPDHLRIRGVPNRNDDYHRPDPFLKRPPINQINQINRVVLKRTKQTMCIMDRISG